MSTPTSDEMARTLDPDQHTLDLGDAAMVPRPTLRRLENVTEPAVRIGVAEALGEISSTVPPWGTPCH